MKQKTKLSVNINKYALLRNSRGNDQPNLLDCVDLCLSAGAHGITVHPRRDERHIRFDDVPVIAEHLRRHYPDIEYNIECEPSDLLLDLVCQVKPDQCTLVPVSPGEITSDHGFTKHDIQKLIPMVARLQDNDIRVSLFVDCIPDTVRALVETGADRVELYTGPYAKGYVAGKMTETTRAVYETAAAAKSVGFGLNAGHDLNAENLLGLADLPDLLEVSIGHAMICRALEIGTVASIKELLTALRYSK